MFVNESESSDLRQKYITFFTLSKSEVNDDSTKEYEALIQELFGDYISPDIMVALRKYKTPDEFVNYMLNRENGDILMPAEKGKTEAEMNDYITTKQ